MDLGPALERNVIGCEKTMEDSTDPADDYGQVRVYPSFSY